MTHGPSTRYIDKSHPHNYLVAIFAAKKKKKPLVAIFLIYK